MSAVLSILRSERTRRAAEALEVRASEKAGMTLEAAARRWLSGQDIGGISTLCEPASPYEQSLWVHRCIAEIQKTGGGIPVRLLREGEAAGVGGRSRRPEIRRRRKVALRPWPGRKAVGVGRALEGEVVDAGPAADLLAHPNDYQDWPKFFGATIGQLYLAGRVGWYLADQVGLRPGSLHVLAGRRLKPVWLDAGRSAAPVLLGYEYALPQGRPVGLAIEEVKYFHLWSPAEGDPLAGLSPLLPGRFAVATDYAASLFNASLLANGADPGLVLRFPQNLTTEQAASLRESLAARYAGPGNAKRPLVLEGGGEALNLGQTMADLQFDVGKKTTRLELCCLLGVPPVVAGWVEAAGDSSAYTQNALRQFYEQTVLPLLDGFAPALQDIVSRIQPGLVAWFDCEDQPVVRDMRRGGVDTALKLFTLGYTANSINDALDLGMPEVPWGDTGFLSAGLIPAEEAARGTAVAPEGEPPPAPEPEEVAALPAATKAADEAMEKGAERIWNAFARAFESLARRGRPIIRTHLFVQERKLLAALKRSAETEPRSLALAASAPIRNPQSEIRNVNLNRMLVEVFADPKALATFRARIRSYLADGRQLGLRQALSEAGLRGDALEEALRRLMRNPAIDRALASEAVRVSTRLHDRTRRLLKTSLQEGLDAGEDVRRLASRVRAVMGGERAQALQIARNTVGQVLSAARQDGAVDAGMTHKVWIHSRGPGVRRPLHVEAEGRYRLSPCPIHAPFEVGGAELMYPRDFSAGRPDQTVNCQCLAIMKRMAAGAAPTTAAILADYDGRAFLDAGSLSPAPEPPPSVGHGEKDEAES